MSLFLSCCLLYELILVNALIRRYCTPFYLVWYVRMRLKGKKLFPSAKKKNPDHKTVVVSLTTIPSRLDSIFASMNSILRQTRPPDRIYLNIPFWSIREKKGYQIPKLLKTDDRITLIRCPQDLGPILKLSETLKRETNPDTLIITVDDDTIYPRHFIETLLAFHEQYPKAALGFRGWRLPESGKFLDRRILYGNSITVPLRVDVLSGISGVLYIRKQFKDDFFSPKGHPAEAFFVDDICISGYLETRGEKKMLIPFPMREPFARYIQTKKSNPLWKINQDGNNDQTMIDFYFH